MKDGRRLLGGEGGLCIAASILVISVFVAHTDAYPSQVTNVILPTRRLSALYFQLLVPQVSKYINSMEQDVGQGALILRQILAMQGKMKQDRDALAELIADMERVMPAYLADPGDNIRMTRKRSEHYRRR